MTSNQSSDLSSKQQELVNRLEKIRQGRNTEKKNRNENRNRNKNRRNRNEKAKNTRNKSSSPNRPVQRSNQNISNKKISKKNNTKSTHKKSSSITKGLQNGDDLAQAIVLSEILSKPIALRKHKR